MSTEYGAADCHLHPVSDLEIWGRWSVGMTTAPEYFSLIQKYARTAFLHTEWIVDKYGPAPGAVQ